MSNFWDYSVWGTLNLVAVMLVSLLVGNFLKKKIHFLKVSLIPTSVIGGVLVLIIALIYHAVSGEQMLDTNFFGGNGRQMSEVITYHCLALGFIAATFNPNKRKLTGKRATEIFNTGCTTVASYLLQAVFGLGITILFAVLIKKDFFKAAGVLLPFGYGQGTGQALNYGNIYETDYGFVGGRSFGLTIAAFGFISAAIGGVIYLNILRKKGKYKPDFDPLAESYTAEEIQNASEIPMNGSIDKMSVQMGLVLLAYTVTYIIMYFLGNLAPGLKATIYGFNFLFGVLVATLINLVLRLLKNAGIVNKQYVNEFLLKRISSFFFDLMIVAGICAIQIEVLKGYWFILIILGLAGAFITFFYNRYVAKKMFSEYEDEQFLVMYGMLTGTASTGMILLRELDKDLKTPAAENLVYQQLPAIVFGFPMMLIAPFAPKEPVLTLVICIAFFAVMNLILFRQFIFKKKK